MCLNSHRGSLAFLILTLIPSCSVSPRPDRHTCPWARSIFSCGMISTAHVTNSCGWWSVKPLNQSWDLVLERWERNLIQPPPSPSRAGVSSGVISPPWGGSTGRTVRESLQVSLTPHSHEAKHYISWLSRWDRFLSWGEKCHSERARAGPRGKCHVFLKKPCPRERWATLALANWWNGFPGVYRYCHLPRIMVWRLILDTFC